MLLTLLYIALIALILWSVVYIIWRIVRSFRGKGGCSCGYYQMKASETESIEQVAAFADEEMYKVKLRKKAMRKM